VDALSVLANAENMEARIFENYDLSSAIDAYFVKPYIGYLPQDFSNVWMQMSCFDNVYFSLLLRSKAKGVVVEHK
jgi:ABC-type multidrug transport system ATPase subunit